ncbi:MAG: nuclear transport factor 2 family protein [Ruminococcus sp.]|nr:nuclear transport factor 2 family protein [Ruminococcus sp.]
MNEEQLVRALYAKLFDSIINRDIPALGECLDRRFTLTTVTGKTEPAAGFLDSVREGRLSLSKAEHSDINLRIIGMNAWLIGRTTAVGSLYGTSEKTWKLVTKLSAVRTLDGWRFLDGRMNTAE